MTPDRPLIFASRTSDPGQTPLEFLSFNDSDNTTVMPS
jgi:hypothetical protein